MKRHIQVFDTFRVFAMLTIFFNHLNYLADTNFGIIYSKISYARLGVDFFFVLSGYVLALGYQDKFSKNVTKQDWIFFIRRRISKIYIPYLVCLILGMIRFIYNASGGVHLKEFVFRIVISLPLLQSLVPFSNYSQSFNAVAWFMSCIAVFYLITPTLLHMNNHLRYRLKWIVNSCVLNLFLFGVVYMVFRNWQYYQYPELNLSLVYSSVYIRIFAFCTGIIIYDLFEYCSEVDTISIFFKKYATKFEILISVVMIFWWIYASNTWIPVVIQEEINIVLASAIIVIFSSQAGEVSNFLNRQKLLGKFGSISMEFYLVHYLVINIGVDLIFPIIEINNFVLGCSVLTFCGISIILALGLHCISKRILSCVNYKLSSRTE